MAEEAANRVLFFILSFLVLGGALRFIFAKNILHNVLYFFLSVLAVAGIFFLLRAPFVAATQVLIYAGAITVLILFVVMLTITRMPEVAVIESTQALAIAVAGILLLVLGNFLAVSKWMTSGVPAQDTITTELADVLFTKYLLPFEIAAVLLLVALIAAVYMALGTAE